MQSSAIPENSKFGNVPFEHGRFGRSKPASHYMAGCCQPQIWANCSHSQARPHPSHESAQSHHSPWWLCGMLCKKIHFFLPSPHQSWPLGGRGGVLLWAQHGGLASGARILAEAVRWSGFSCNCRGDFPVVFQPQLSCSCRHSQCCRRITGTAVAATACPSWAAGGSWEGQRGPCLHSNVPHRRCRAGSSGGYAAGWLFGSGADAYVCACHCK